PATAHNGADLQPAGRCLNEKWPAAITTLRLTLIHGDWAGQPVLVIQVGPGRIPKLRLDDVFRNVANSRDRNAPLRVVIAFQQWHGARPGATRVRSGSSQPVPYYGRQRLFGNHKALRRQLHRLNPVYGTAHRD